MCNVPHSPFWTVMFQWEIFEWLLMQIHLPFPSKNVPVVRTLNMREVLAINFKHTILYCRP